MSIDYKKLFGQKDVILTNEGREALGAEIESVNYMTEYFDKKQRFIPPVDFSKPKNFARFGSAEKYYIDAFDRIYKTYPYDGSLKERVQWELSSSYLDLHIFDNVYPRTNGYVIFSVDGWGTLADSSSGYGATSTASYEYIFVKGGPNTSTRSTGEDIRDTDGDYKDGYANVWDYSKNRESNLKIGGVDGNTVEFWLKKDNFLGSASATNKEVILDLHTSEFISSSVNYGRLTIELTASLSDSPFRVTYMSGTSGFNYATLGSSLTTASIADSTWHHYAFSFKNSGSSIEAKMFVDGACNQSVITGSSIDYVSGNINATIGSLLTAPSGTYAPTKGWGKLSASLDEFRFWKTQRTSQQIGRQYIEPIGGGTNTDDANTTLGVYYKFNEGITQTSSIDKTILDYSGRISNGTYTGYSTNTRNTGSAMVESKKVNKEFKDPILYNFHPDVLSLRDTKKEEGRIYDYANNSSIYFTLPSWIIEEDEAKEYSPLRNLTQIIGSYFDSLASQVSAIPKLKHKDYLSSSFKPYPFSDRLLESVGFTYFPELFAEASALEQFRNRDDKQIFKQKLYDVKNRIYQNIYNNIIYIYKSKGTEKSFRNLIRCFGLDDEIYKMNLYGNHVTYQLKDNYKSVAESKKYINFALTGTHEATVYPASSSANPNSTSFISGTQGQDLESGLAFTMETEVAFPRRYSASEVNTVARTADGTSKIFRSYTPSKTASLFGVHQTQGIAENNLTWAATDYANFQVRAIKRDAYSKRCYFDLTGTSATVVPALTSSYFDEVYDDTRWTFSVGLRPTNYPQANLPGGSGQKTYTVEFYGVEKVLDTIKNEFLVTSSINATDASRFMSNPKSIFIGAHRQNFSGTLLQSADGGISSTRVWLTNLTTGTIRQHAQDVKNYGVPNPYRSAFLYQSSMTGTYVPEIHTLVLNWTFDTITGSNASGQFLATDFSSGSADFRNRYNWIGDIVGKQYLPQGYNFPANFSGSVNNKYVYSARKTLPEIINSSDMVSILSEDDKFFNKNNLLRPSNYYMYIEKSMYQTISEEMIRIFSSIKDFNNLIGEPVNKYRDRYKDMEKLRQLFYERVSNTPDLDKYIEFYKWIDTTLDVLLGYLVPASLDISDQYGSNISTVVESHILERNKYKWQYPTLDDKTPPRIEGSVLGINELLYDWEFGHAPIPAAQDENCLWWKERALRTDSPLSSSNPNFNNNKQTVLNSIVNISDASEYTLGSTSSSGIVAYSGSTYAIRKLAKPYNFQVDQLPIYKGGAYTNPNKNIGFFNAINQFKAGGQYGIIAASSSNLESFKDCNDDLSLNNGKRKFSFKAESALFASTFGDSNQYKGDKILPFNLFSASLSGGYHDKVNNDFNTNTDITNLHLDVYGHDKEVPLQGPFTEKYVGGKSHRHVFTNFTPSNTTLDDSTSRLEGWALELDSNILRLRNADYGRAADSRTQYFRDEFAKRPVNIKNIKQTTGSTSKTGQSTDPIDTTVIGNYSKDYDILSTGGRSINNRYFVIAEGNLSSSIIDSTAVSGILDFALLRRDLTGSNDYVFVNHFAAPGGFEVSSRGYLDTAAEEYSVYNALPWRNLTVREPLQELLTDHTKQFGYFSDTQNSASYELAGTPYPGTSGSVSESNYLGSASFHKVNRNTIKRVKYGNAFSGDKGTIITSSVYDNWFVQHQIPQTDMQYVWITASVTGGYTGSALYGFEQPNFDNASLASTDITFISASATGAFDIDIDFAGLNTLIYDPLTASLNILSASDNVYRNTEIAGIVQPNDFNSLILHRQGPYGWPSWKQIRGATHPVIRSHYRTNRHSFLTYKTELNNDAIGRIATPVVKKSLISQIEPPITSKYKPFEHNLEVKTKHFSVMLATGQHIGTKNLIINHTYGNEKSYFTQKVSGSADLNKLDSITVKAGTGQEALYKQRNNKKLVYDSLNYFIVSDEISGDANPVDKFNSLKIGETIYPREHFTYLKKTRQRDNFQNNFWRDARSDRNQTFITNSQGTISQSGQPPLSQSMWPLDARYNFATTASGVHSGRISGAFEGELQNSYTQGVGLLGAIVAKTLPGACYNRRIAEVAPDTNHSVLGVIWSGDTKWEAADQAGLSPFYNDYDSYIEELKRVGKEYSIIPEFRISEHMDYYIKNNPNEPGDFLADNPNLFSITGSTLSSSGDKTFYTTYTTTDFMQHFGVVRSDYAKTAIPTELTLECKGLMKFLPYDGFFPADRTLELARLFSQSYGPTANLGGAHANWQTIVRPIVAPGLLYNSIKSGIAVDWPYVANFGGPSGIEITLSGTAGNDLYNSRLSGAFEARLPFEALADPDFYLNGTQFSHVDGAIQALLSTGSVGQAENPLFMYAMNNFLAEVPTFFLQNSGLSTLKTKSIKNTRFAEAGKRYIMRIVCSHSEIQNLFDIKNSRRTKTMRAAQTASFIYNPPTITMYNRSFNLSTKKDYVLRHLGYAKVAMALAPDGYVGIVYGSSFGPKCDAPWYETDVSNNYLVTEASYEPYTPPYYNGYSHVELAFTADPDVSNPISLSTILGNMSASHYRETLRATTVTGTTVGNNSMKLSASINWNQLIVDNNDNIVLAIQPKWECPVLDFNDADITLPASGSGSVAKGMWHQYGSVPTGDKGITLSIQNISKAEIIDNDLGPSPLEKTGSLAKLLGFDDVANRSVKLGRVAEGGKLVKEAVVAIPFKMDNNIKSFFNINRITIDWAESELDNTTGSFQQTKPPKHFKPAQSVIEMVKKLRQYIMPPTLDYMTNKSIKPFAMVLFEFEWQLKQKDLVNIWQNLPPKENISRTLVGSQATISIDLLRRAASEEDVNKEWKGFSLLNHAPGESYGIPFPTDIQWIIFKVKQKAKTNYFDLTARDEAYIAQATKAFGAPTVVSSEPAKKTPYSYNWPYDFFSLVELVKIDSTYTLAPEPLPGVEAGAISGEEKAKFKNIAESSKSKKSSKSIGKAKFKKKKIYKKKKGPTK